MKIRAFVVAAVAVTVVSAVGIPLASADQAPPSGCGDAGTVGLETLGVKACPDLQVEQPSTPWLPASPPSSTATTAPCAPSPQYDKCEAWVSEFYNGPGNGVDSIGDQSLHGPIIGTSPDGQTVYTAGYSDGDPSTTQDRDIAVLAFNAQTGAKLWDARFGGDADHRDAVPLGLSVSSAGVFVTAMLSNGTQDWFSRIVGFDATGALMWDRPLSWLSYAVVATPGGRVVTTGAQAVETAQGIRVDAVTTAFDARTGSTVWTQRQEGERDLGYLGWRLGLSGDGTRVAVALSKYRLEEPQAGMTVYLGVTTYDVTPKPTPAEEGQLVSAAEYPVFGYIPAGIVVNRDGSRAYVAQGLAHGSENWQQTLTLAVDTDAGRPIWARRYAGPRASMSVVFPWYYGPIALSPNEQFLYVGSFVSTAMNNGGNGFAVEAIHTMLGERIWIQEHPGNVSLCFGCGPTLTAVGNQVVVTTRAPELLWAYQFMTVAYDDDHGYRVWTRVFRDGRSGHSGGVVAAPDGKRVFVAGSAGTYTATASDRSVDILVAAFDV